MIPYRLYISGFLSYREPVDLDFTSFELACIAGANGAGKSSLLDAITWALFGIARKRDDSVINARSSTAEVSLTFAYEGNLYRVQRIKPREKTAQLEFHIQQDDGKTWKPLTERTLRETETRIQNTLRLDYDTFVNASFFLQGKADQFTQQRPGDRKRLLSNILGLEIWETYRQGAADRRKSLEDQIAGLDGQLREITAELAEEQPRKERLSRLEDDLQRLSRERQAQEATLENIRRISASLAEQRRLVEAQSRHLDADRIRLQELLTRWETRRQESTTYHGLISRAAEIRASYEAWQASRQALAHWEETASRFREQEMRREAPRDAINAERARLLQEREILESQGQLIEEQRPQVNQQQSEFEAVQLALAETEKRLEQRAQLDGDLQAARQQQAEARSENPRLKAEMDELKERIDHLTLVEGATCPLCGQPLSPLERESLITGLNQRGRELGDRYRSNQALMRSADGRVRELEEGLRALRQVEAELRVYNQRLSQATSRLELLQAQIAAWETEGRPRWQVVIESLEAESFAAEARVRLAEVDAELKAIGYDAVAHDQARADEVNGRAAELDLRELEKAQAALAPLEREVNDLQAQAKAFEHDLAKQEQEYEKIAAGLNVAEAQAPNLLDAERSFYDLQEQENRLRLEVGAARQKVMVLEDLKDRRRVLESQRQELARQVGLYRQLERAFGKDGVPALLIEQALPQIENRANELLDRLSGGNMSVRFVTQSAYKDKRRDDLRETLDIQISDGVSVRDYEMFSGGEAFRVNFAIRLALAEVLAQRAGARLQTLVIDEGFGSQDAQGRQRLIEAINLVRRDFAKILVITHIDELKDQFPNRIEVEKTELGSTVTVT